MTNILAVKPIMSEKAYSLSQSGVYMFEVPLGANKLQIKAAVQQQYSVGVVGVRSAHLQGKPKSSRRRRGRGVEGQRAETKRAFVTLKSGDELPIFASVEADEHSHNDHNHDPKADKKAKNPLTKPKAKETK